MSKEISVPRFPILGFRIPNSVWHMGILEYRTMRLGGRGAHMGFAWAGCNGVRHGMSWGGSWCAIGKSWRGTIGKGRGTKGGPIQGGTTH